LLVLSSSLLVFDDACSVGIGFSCLIDPSEGKLFLLEDTGDVVSYVVALPGAFDEPGADLFVGASGIKTPPRRASM
jgi:hypothetical protein